MQIHLSSPFRFNGIPNELRIAEDKTKDNRSSKQQTRQQTKLKTPKKKRGMHTYGGCNSTDTRRARDVAGDGCCLGRDGCKRRGRLLLYLEVALSQVKHLYNKTILNINIISQ